MYIACCSLPLKGEVHIISLIADTEGKILVFTPDGIFINQDTVHFTKFGATFFTRLLDSKFREIMKVIMPSKYDKDFFRQI